MFVVCSGCEYANVKGVSKERDRRGLFMMNQSEWRYANA